MNIKRSIKKCIDCGKDVPAKTITFTTVGGGDSVNVVLDKHKCNKLPIDKSKGL